MPDSKRKFWQQFLKSRREIGSVTPSSRHLSKAILSKMDFTKDRIIIELGPGTGVFTYAMLAQMSAGSKLIVIELNEEMYQLLNKSLVDSRVILVHGSATEMLRVLAENKLEHVDYIVSSLPLSVMPETIANQIFTDSKSLLGSHGKYIQFMYSLVLKAKLDTYFAHVSKSFVFLNFPPAFVFDCHNHIEHE